MQNLKCKLLKHKMPKCDKNISISDELYAPCERCKKFCIFLRKTGKFIKILE